METGWRRFFRCHQASGTVRRQQMAVLFSKPRSRAAIGDARDSSAVNGARIHEIARELRQYTSDNKFPHLCEPVGVSEKAFVGVTKDYLRLRIEAHLYHWRGDRERNVEAVLMLFECDI